MHKLKLFFAAALAVLSSTAAAVGERIHAAIINYQARSGLILYAGPPTEAQFNAARVTMPGQSEAVRQRLYDYQVYPTAGVGQMNFFQLPIGQGITSTLGAVVGSPKTYGDTNSNIGGQLPSGMQFLCTSIEVQFFAGSSAAANTYLPAASHNFAAAAAIAVGAMIQDVNVFYQSGWLEFKILEKVYVREAPLVTFPPRNTLSFNGAVASNSATVGETLASFARADGATYEIAGGILLQPAVNFNVSLNWPGVVATGSGFNGRVGVILDGWVQRASQ